MIRSGKNKILRTFFYLIVAVFIMIQIYPIFWVICSSLKTPDEMTYTAQYALPSSFYLGNYISALTISAIPKYFLNSTIVAVLTLLGIVVLGCPVAFVISKVRIKHADALMGFFLFGMMIPIFACLIWASHVYLSLHRIFQVPARLPAGGSGDRWRGHGHCVLEDRGSHGEKYNHDCADL